MIIEWLLPESGVIFYAKKTIFDILTIVTIMTIITIMTRVVKAQV